MTKTVLSLAAALLVSVGAFGTGTSQAFASDLCAQRGVRLPQPEVEQRRHPDQHRAPSPSPSSP